jgi:hypothetical protein
MSNVDQFFQWEREIEFSIVDVGFNGCISGYGAKFISVDIERERAQNRAHRSDSTLTCCSLSVQQTKAKFKDSLYFYFIYFTDFDI